MAYLHSDKEQFKDAISNSFAHGTQLYRRDDEESS